MNDKLEKLAELEHEQWARWIILHRKTSQDGADRSKHHIRI
ncbi:hypothetical protein SAMN05444972_102333 [Marininema halotolerans]|uniref:Uncharacterized protein n=1 Tax=Marininema halotolerans TaxID=1155944 RepID=A0A1I6Q496_9BACL|nr:hypothetical protein SAMN05444972_102333 [Marininema halotolerans]